MWAIEIEHRVTGKLDLVMGYNFEDACRKKGLNPNDYRCIHTWYED